MNRPRRKWKLLVHAKAQKFLLVTACDEAAIAADHDEDAENAAMSNLADIQKIHDFHIAAGAAAESGAEYEQAMALTVSTKTEILRALISVDMAKSKAQTSRAKHVSAIAAVRAAETAVVNEALSVLNAELLELAEEFEVTMDRALSIGSKLRRLSGNDELHQPFNLPRRSLPTQVEEALARLPVMDSIHIPVSVLRGVNEASDGFAARLSALAV